MPECQKCGKEFDSERGLNIHKSKVHDNGEDDGKEELEDMKEKISKLKDKIKQDKESSGKEESVEDGVKEGSEESKDDKEVSDVDDLKEKSDEQIRKEMEQQMNEAFGEPEEALDEKDVEKSIKKEVERSIQEDKEREEDKKEVEVKGDDTMSDEEDVESKIDQEKLEKMKQKISDNKLEDKSDDELAGIQLGIEETKEKFEKLQEELDKVVVGLEEAKRSIALALLVDGNLLLEGVPGLAKSLLVETLSNIIKGCNFNRIQFVPDMLPADILGNRVYNQKKGEFYINKGPVFANFILADEINRAPPKTQAAMMEVMQEKKVNIEKKEFELEPPFLVLATQNPLEQKGTYPLPEAIIDRFFMKLDLGYPLKSEEMEILEANTIRTAIPFKDLNKVIDKQDILEAQEVVRNIYLSESVRKYIVDIVIEARGTENPSTESMKYVDYGPGPRASIWLAMGSSAEAVLNGRAYVIPEDVKKVAKGILRHRILLNYEGKISDKTTDDIVEDILQEVGTV